LKKNYSFYSKTILCISDLHIPYHHPDSFAFLKHLKKLYKPDLVVSLGDLGDFHNISFHDSDPDLPSAGDELKKLQEYSVQLEKIFPNMIIIGSNHGDLPLRRLFAAGLSKKLLRPYCEIYGVGKGWVFADDLTLTSKSQTIYFNHGIVKNGLKLATQRGVNVVQGHYHTEFNIQYASNPQDLLWSLQTGCLINPQSLAFAYNKLQVNRPIIGTAVIVDGQPILEPMILNSKGRWIGV
jgi:hypothetical protein